MPRPPSLPLPRNPLLTKLEILTYGQAIIVYCILPALAQKDTESLDTERWRGDTWPSNHCIAYA